MAAREALLVGAIVKAIRARWPEAWHFKVVGNPYQESGIPDLLVCVRGVLIGLEVKNQRPGESADHARARATPLQLAQIRRIADAGGAAAVVLSVEEALATVEAGIQGR